MFNIGFGELLLILVIALILFGPKRLPELAQAIGKSVREYRKAADGENKPKSAKRSKKLAG
ncbi:twin-arginine translocase TatA/TatE family subunit [Candidatus Woesearchaeota archaeon CG08_land_8_20_14_0_20_47_9]|nr:MAG: Sec-independent protein translocase TatA [Candidatus Woesearchaeota archaeon CG1_02_47_18]PIN73004.1 MAG: twin-arginine translocase TatA/TatE family subunit [Candidatus Woesearchaeota archaeon CG10_big_fil_rev_8_21_14_0_10_47_5]PIO03166.1 MAG: twin-arginine translocase TatA/TatE family subunit [Candidatus Woesearchaeota archaeon CG08_land_8_20_14_0_20_47_9]HII30305.1 twin-arginine translocase TatA/TatE family subunit [Candidatus Woesearchaeota archaeon]